MRKDLVLQLKEKLLEEKEEIKRILSSFALQDKKLPEDWDTKFPKFDGGKLEEGADEVEEYINLLPIEGKLELKLLDIKKALEKIEKGKKYGVCEKCGKTIEEKRIKIIPETKFCSKCSRSNP